MSDDETTEHDSDPEVETARVEAKPKARPTNAARTEAKKSTTDGDAESPKASAAERAWDIRRNRLRRIGRRFALVVGLPTLFAILYYTAWASDEYVSETIVNVQAPEKPGDALGEGNFIANRGPDLRLVRDTLLSRATFDEMVENTDWLAHYRDNGDVFTRLRGQGSEDAYDYFRKKVSISSAGNNAPLRLKVRAFSGESAADFAAALLEITRRRVNEIATRPLDDQIARAKKRLAEAKAALAKLPAPADDASDAGPSPRRTAALERVTQAEATVSRLSLARDGQTRYLTVISGPSAPDEARYPQRVWGIATVFVVAFALMGIFSLLFGAIREHAKV